MNCDEDFLKIVLSKVTLFTEADNAQELEKRILAKPVGIPKNSRELPS